MKFAQKHTRLFQQVTQLFIQSNKLYDPLLSVDAGFYFSWSYTYLSNPWLNSAIKKKGPFCLPTPRIHSINKGTKVLAEKSNTKKKRKKAFAPLKTKS